MNTNGAKSIKMPKTIHHSMSKKKGWVILLSTLFLLWIFGVAVGPWLQHKIPGMDKIVTTIEENDIDAGAYFYTEIEGSYNGENYLRQSLEMAAPDQSGVTLSFLLGIFLCLLILALGWRYLPE
jgi:hypothetical protein